MKLKKLSTKELEAELTRRKEEEAKATAVPPSPLKVPDFTRLVGHVKSMVEGLAADGHAGKDYDHYCFELALEAVYGKSIWDWWNKQDNIED